MESKGGRKSTTGLAGIAGYFIADDYDQPYPKVQYQRKGEPKKQEAKKKVTLTLPR
jgi:hypothetical protein